MSFSSRVLIRLERDAVSRRGYPTWEDREAVARSFGFEVIRRDRDREWPGGYMWNGVDGILRGDDPIHELAHYIVATPERRAQPCFGLGGEPEGFGTPHRTMGYDEADSEEWEASLLGIIVQNAHGLPIDDLFDHGWAEYNTETQEVEWIDRENTEATLDRLIARGIIDAEGVPIWERFPPHQ